MFTNNPAYDTLLSPPQLYTRYIWEDIPDGLIPFLFLARQFNVQTPILEAMYTLATRIFKEDWMDEARTLDNLNLSHLSLEQLLNFVKTCELPG